MPNTAGPRVECLGCGDIIQSKHRHDFKYCKCESIAVDGGSAYLRMLQKDAARYRILDAKEPGQGSKPSTEPDV